MKKRSFTLIELLIVLVLIGIVYSIYFFTVVKSKTPIPFSLKTMKQYITNSSKVYKKKNLSLIYFFDKKVIYLIDNKNEILETIEFDGQLTTYVLKKDEILDVKQYRAIELDDHYFEPTFIYKKLDKDLYNNLILNTNKDEWYYYNTYFGAPFEKFINQDELILFIKKKDYLPMYAGNPE